MIATLLDTETTGLIENRSAALDKLPEIIEFYCIKADLKRKGKKLSELHTLIKPSSGLPRLAIGSKTKTITQITGITEEDLKESPLFPRVAGQIFEFLERSPLIIAQNASFDRDMLDIEAERLGRKLVWPPLICTVEQTVHYKGYRLNLGDLYEYLFGERFPGAHRAKADTEALLRCCVEMFKRGDL